MAICCLEITEAAGSGHFMMTMMKHRDLQVAASSVMLTVWKRSSMSFQGTDGFTVFDPHGTLVFRVDNYSRKNGYGLVLMDGVGNALLSLKPKILSMQYQWRAYRGDQDGGEKANVFFMRSPSVLSNFQAAGRKHVAEIFMGTHSGWSSSKHAGSQD
ncbi:hypothetical protein OIU79_021518 [Salix purpurea]|uniref:Protein LURP-one-related 8-like n=1 Tax=Salix purpurea TaxID=77065 RepID=A0A9Q1ABT4_SALPP|nr:hypothetical protein OIU79_021518 [Salix purpurea]